jgi:Entner-Doudoroff aldolase
MAAMRADSTPHAALLRHRLLAILRYPDGGDIVAAMRALHRGGVAIAEVTADTPGVLDAIAEASAADDGLVLGMGTVTSVSAVRDCRAAGGRFVVSPGLLPEVIRAALDTGLEPIPGIATATEVLEARQAGARLLKLFPAGPLGTSYLRAMLGPFPDAEFIPTGGIKLDHIADWLDAGAVAVAMGSELAGRKPPAVPDDERALKQSARRATQEAGHIGTKQAL